MLLWIWLTLVFVGVIATGSSLILPEKYQVTILFTSAIATVVWIIVALSAFSIEVPP